MALLEADHGALKRLINPTRRLKTLPTTSATIKGFEVMRMIRRGRGNMRDAIEEFQLWKLNMNPDHTAILTCGDGNGGVVFTKAIEYTDFPLVEITLYFMNNTILLPSEY